MPAEPQKTQKHNTFLAVDYGDRRVGLAIGFRDVKMAFPRNTIDRNHHPDFIPQILQIAKEERVHALVVGMPVHPEGKANDKSEDVKGFLAELKQHTELPVYTQNEAWSSADAKEMTSHMKTTKKKEKGRIDQMAAAVILQRFFEEQLS